MYTTHTTQGEADTKPGKLPGFCSDKWKARIIHRELRSRGVAACDMWMGMSLDEMKRVKYSTVSWITKHYVLIFDKPFGVPLRRAGCVEVIRQAGWPDAPRSACSMCPNMSDAEWLDLKGSSPGEFAKAVALDYEIRETDPHAYLHKSGKPLDLVDFAELARTDAPNLFNVEGCESGHCFV